MVDRTCVCNGEGRRLKHKIWLVISSKTDMKEGWRGWSPMSRQICKSSYQPILPSASLSAELPNQRVNMKEFTQKSTVAKLCLPHIISMPSSKVLFVQFFEKCMFEYWIQFQTDQYEDGRRNRRKCGWKWPENLESDLKSWKSRWDLAGQCEHAKLPAFLCKFGGGALVGFGLIWHVHGLTFGIEPQSNGR